MAIFHSSYRKLIHSHHHNLQYLPLAVILDRNTSGQEGKLNGWNGWKSSPRHLFQTRQVCFKCWLHIRLQRILLKWGREKSEIELTFVYLICEKLLDQCLHIVNIIQHSHRVAVVVIICSDALILPATNYNLVAPSS